MKIIKRREYFEVEPITSREFIWMLKTCGYSPTLTREERIKRTTELEEWYVKASTAEKTSAMRTCKHFVLRNPVVFAGLAEANFQYRKRIKYQIVSLISLIGWIICTIFYFIK